MVCLDTSFLIDMIKGRDAVKKIVEEIDKGKIAAAIASPSIVELFRGLYLESNLKHVEEDEIKKINEILFSSVVLSLDKESAIKAGKIEADLINRGELIDFEDILIAAIAIQNNEILLTRNKKHFEKIPGLEIETY